jgi:Short C-terminal domain
MVVIFGWGAGEAQDLGEVAPATCPNCHNNVFLHHIRSEKKISLYFIPLVPYGSNEYLACPVCRSGIGLPEAQRPTVEAMRTTTMQFRRRQLAEAPYLARVDAFWKMLGVGATGAQVVHRAPTIPPPAAAAAPAPVPSPGTADPVAGPSISDRLAGLAKLHASGVLTDEEFAAAKRKILGM